MQRSSKEVVLLSVWCHKALIVEAENSVGGSMALGQTGETV